MANGGSCSEDDRRKSQLTMKEQDLHCQGLMCKDFQRLCREDSTCCLRTSSLTVQVEVVQDVHLWHRMEERSNHTTMNLQSESERLLRELRDEKSRDECTQRRSRRDRVSEREEKSPSGERCRICELRNPRMRSRWQIDMWSLRARTRANTTRTE